jgi:hypothetical protein
LSHLHAAAAVGAGSVPEMIQGYPKSINTIYEITFGRTRFFDSQIRKVRPKVISYLVFIDLDLG